MRWQITTATVVLCACGSGTPPVSTPTDGVMAGTPVPAWASLEDGRSRIAIVGDFGTADANARAVEEQVRLWDVAKGECEQTVAGHSERDRALVQTGQKALDVVWSARFSPDGTKLVSSTYETLRVWRIV